MTVTEQTLIEYQDKFKNILPHWRVNTEAKTWYKQKFRFRLELGCNGHWEQVRRWMWTHGKTIIDKVRDIDPHARMRREGYLRIFTNETAVLDAFLDDPELRVHVYGLTTSNTQYIDEFNNLDNIAVDVKLVSALKYNPDIPYQVDFETYWGWQTTANSNRKTQRENLLELYNFVQDNKDDLSLPHELNRWCKRVVDGLESFGYYYGAVRVYCKSSDNIPLLYIMFQDGIKKVYKLVKKEKVSN
jgi:hypothetical protein